MTPSPSPVPLTAYAPGAYTIHFGVDVTPRVRLLNKDRADYIRNLFQTGPCQDRGRGEASHLALTLRDVDRIEARVNHLPPDECQVVIGDWTSEGWKEWART